MTAVVRHARFPGRRLAAEQRAADVMSMARTVFCEKGYGATTVADVAARLGVVEGTVFRYFSSKRALFIAVVEAWYRQIMSDYDRQLQGMRSTLDRLRYLVWRHLVVIHDDPAMCRLVFEELRSDPEYRKTAVYALNREYTRRTIEIIESAIASGEFRAGVPVRVVRDLIYGGVEHHTWAYLRGEGDFCPDAAADAIIELVYRGLVSSPAADSPIEALTHRLEVVAQRLEEAAGCASGHPESD